MLIHYGHKSSRGSENALQTRCYVRFDLTALLMQTHGISRHTDWQIFTEISEQHSSFVVRAQQSRKLPGLLTPSPRLLDPKNEGSVFSRNVGEY
jgi:hypothetical protein